MLPQAATLTAPDSEGYLREPSYTQSYAALRFIPYTSVSVPPFERILAGARIASRLGKNCFLLGLDCRYALFL